jgi:hypothetical protein
MVTKKPKKKVQPSSTTPGAGAVGTHRANNRANNASNRSSGNQ